MTLHVFNPEHEHALAADLAVFTPPHAARQLRSDLSFLPALWAEDGDVVIVDNVSLARERWMNVKLQRRPDVSFATLGSVKEFFSCGKEVSVSPWGWDKTIRTTLLRAGVPAEMMPSEEALAVVRRLSNRSLAVRMLTFLADGEGLTGYACVCETYEDVCRFLARHGEIVVKAPWSCSGRGVRYITEGALTDNDSHWIQRVISLQGSVVAEVRCRKEVDFAVEFMAERDGSVRAMGLSLFTTSGSAYTGNVLATEEEKRCHIAEYLPLERLDSVIRRIERLLADSISGAYVGPLGVDMMVTAGDCGAYSTLYHLNPCVEINLRRTMGHVALALSERGQRGVMGITYEDKSYNITLTNNIL